MNTYLPSMRHLVYLAALSEQKSFSKAARACHVTQSTLSAGIKELETLLGQSVADRSQRRITLTPFGQDVLKQARKVLSDAEKIVALAKAAQQPLSGRLRLGVIPTIAPYWLPQHMGTLKKAYPDLRLELSEQTTEVLRTRLEAGEIDAAVIAFPYDTGDLAAEILSEEPFFLAAPKDMNLPKNLTISTLEDDHLLVLEDGHCLRDHVLAACQYEARKTASGFRATSLATLIQLVRQGYGYTLLPEMVVKSGTVPKDIQIMPFKGKQPTRKIGLVWRSNSPMARDVEALVESLRLKNTKEL